LPERTVNILGVGNVLMGDDGVGIAAVRAIARRGTPAGAVLHDAGLAVADVLSGLDPADPLIVVDAVRAGGPAGQVYRLSLDALQPDAAALSGAMSLHELSVAPALRLEALTGRVFADVTLLGVEPGRVGWSTELSEPVAAAVETLCDAVLALTNEKLTCLPVGDARP